jgi:hypothetical protein
MDPTASLLTGDVALSGARVWLGFLYVEIEMFALQITFTKEYTRQFFDNSL